MPDSSLGGLVEAPADGKLMRGPRLADNIVIVATGLLTARLAVRAPLAAVISFNVGVVRTVASLPGPVGSE